MEKKLLIRNATGLHARPAAQFVQTAAGFQSSIRIIAGTKNADAKSILSVMGLGITQNTEITIQADGPDAEASLNALEQLVDGNFGEG